MTVIGWREWLTLPQLGIARIKAKIDTGARSSALHAIHIETFQRDGIEMVKFQVHPIQRNSETTVSCECNLLEMRQIRSSTGHLSERPVILTDIEMLGQSWPIELTLINRDEMGFRMLQHIKFLEPALDIVMSHQERYDGTGYPRGLRAEDIPLGARIFAVVDTFDAMTSDRPYRQALAIEDACKEIEDWSGRQFDPNVAAAFLNLPAAAWRAVRERVHHEVTALEEQVRKVLG